MSLTTASPEVRFSECNIDLCAQALLKLVQDVKPCMFTVRLWTTGLIYSLDSLGSRLENPNLVSDTKKTIESLTGALDLSKEVTKFLQDSLDIVNSSLSLLSLKKGFDILPDEILELIFQLVGPKSKGVLQLVCRRFHRLVSNIPQFWSSVFNDFTEDILYKCLERSGTTGLEIMLDVERSPHLLDPSAMLDITLKHSARWRKLTISIGDRWEYAGGALAAIGQRLEESNPLQLQSLAIDFPVSFEDTDDSGHSPFQVDSNSLHFFESMKLPALSFFHITNMVPNSLNAPQLRSMWVELERWGFYCSPVEIANFLRAFPQLEELRVTLQMQLDEEGSIPAVILPNLRTLRLDAEDHLSEGTTELLQAFKMPVIHTVYINFERQTYDDFPDISDWLSALFSCDEYPTLEELSIKFSDMADQKEYGIPFQKFQGLRTLSLDTPGLTPIYFRGDRRRPRLLPALRTLCVGKADKTWMRWLDQTRGMLCRQWKNGGEKFEELRIDLDNYVSLGDLERVFPVKRIVWYLDGDLERPLEFD